MAPGTATAAADSVDCTGSTWTPAFVDVVTSQSRDRNTTTVRVFGWGRCYQPDGGGANINTIAYSQLHRRDRDYGSPWEVVFNNEVCSGVEAGSSQVYTGTQCNSQPDQYPCPVVDKASYWRTYTEADGFDWANIMTYQDGATDNWTGLSGTVTRECLPDLTASP